VSASLLSFIGLLAWGWQAQRPISFLAVARADDDAEITPGGDTQDLTGLQSRFAAVAARVAPSVVAISAAEAAADADASVRTDEINPQKLQDWLDKTTRTVGTGFIIDSDGFILTNEHVIEDSQQYWVTTDEKKVYPAMVVAADPRADLAVLKIPATRLPAVHFVHDYSLRRGQWALTLGNPYGLAIEGDLALSVGVVSATDRSLPRLATKENRLYSNLIQTTAQINPGNSGGPLFDLDGNVIGVNTAVILPQKQSNGIGFAIPISPQLLNEVRDLREGKEIVYAYVGVSVTAATARQRHDLGLADDAGVHVDSVEDGSPAAGPDGLREGDIILQINGQAVGDSDRFVRLAGAAPLDRPTRLRVLREGKPLELAVTPTRRAVQFTVSQENQRLHWRGMVLGPLPTNRGGAVPAASTDEVSGGILVVAIADDSPLKKQGVTAGAVIRAVGDRPVSSLLELQKVLNDVPAEKCTVQLAQPAALVSKGK
jgi:S1-C subfamily serine protease